MPSALRSLLLCGSAALAALHAAGAAAQAGPATRELELAGSGEDINPTSRTVSLTVPLRYRAAYVGDVVVTIDPDDRVRVSAQRVAELLAPLLGKETAATLGAPEGWSGETLQQAGIAVRYNALELALDVDIAADRLATRSIEVSPLRVEDVGSFVEPADFSAYLNMRGTWDYLYDNGGAQSPVLYLDGAARLGGIVAESEGIWQTGGAGQSFRRLRSRLVHDDREHLMRWTAGDLQPVGRGFQSLPEIAGLSLFRTYGVLEPQRVARPGGDRSFTLLRPSTVEVEVNGQLLRRLQLEPGSYDLHDFPFAQGANDVRLVVTDDSGQRQVLRFNIFLDQSQLEAGLTEFGVYAGVLSPSTQGSPHYTDALAISAFVRRGISGSLTLGANLQADRDVQMGGGEMVWSTSIGTLGASLAMSNNRDRGWGHAATVTFQRLTSAGSGDSAAFNLFFERRSRDFSVLGTLSPQNPFRWEAGGGYTRGFGQRFYAGADGRYSRGRDAQPDIYYARATAGYRATDRLNVSGDVRWEKDDRRKQLSGFLTATFQIGPRSNVRADLDSRFNRARLSYSTFRGHGVGAYNVTADLDRSDLGSGVNVAANYFANRAELGFSHYGTFENDLGKSLSQRSSLRFGTSLAVADGAVSMGRPIYDSFAIVRAHPSLKGSSVEVEPTAEGPVAETGRLGSAVDPTLSPYFGRTIAIDAPEAPATADLGQGTFRVFPSYRSGYVLTVGSDFNVSAVGRLLNAEGAPVALVTGSATLVGNDRAPAAMTVFTNRDGRFGLTGLGPGRWVLKMNDDLGSTFTIDIDKDAEGIVRLGELRPTRSIEQDPR